MAVDARTKALLTELVESSDVEVLESLEARRQELFAFTVQIFLGTQMVMSPGKALADFSH